MPPLSELSLKELHEIAGERFVANFEACRFGDEYNNHIQRLIVAAIARERGEAWLGSMTLRRETRGLPILWRWLGQKIPKYSCDFVVPCRDDELVRLIAERYDNRCGDYTADFRRIVAITDRRDLVGGINLQWS